MGDTIVLQTHALGKRFNGRWAVRDLNLSVRRGDIFGFLGPNGAGKSTTIRMILSLITPTAGSVELFGKPLRRHRSEVLARVGGLVERPDFYLYLSARRNLEIIGSLMGGVSRTAIDEVLATVGLSERGKDRVKTYSHGMKQRLGIAQALLRNPEFIVLDEPTSGLDPQGIKEVRDLILTLSSRHAITIFLSSHLLSEIEQTATSMAIINAGTLVVQGGVQELLAGGESSVRIEVDRPEAAAALLATFSYVREVRRDGDALDLSMSPRDAGRLNTSLVGAGFEVRALVPKRSLEEYFLSITEGASDVGPTSRRPGLRRSG